MGNDLGITIVSEEQVAAVLNPGNSYTAVKEALISMEDDARNFPVIRENLGYADAIYGFKSGFDPVSGALGLKSGGYWPNNTKQGLTNHQSTIFLFNPDTGQCQAVVAANLITALRTAAAAAVSVDVLARNDARSLALIGTGHQSAFQLDAVLSVRSFEQVFVWNRSGRSLEKHRQIAQSHGVELIEMGLEEACRKADVIVTITSSFEAFVKAEWITEGTHISCMGTDTAGKEEVEAELFDRARLFTDELAQATTIGELQRCPEGTQIDSLGSVLNGSVAGRNSDQEITVYDGTGVGLQDLACARLILQELEERSPSECLALA